MSAVKGLIKENTRAIASLHASNVSGGIVDIAALGQICQENNLKLIVDSAQSAGILPIQMKDMQDVYKRQVYDTSTGADLTVLEEANELIKRLEDNNNDMPLFTSCCPAWVQFCEKKYPELLPNVSTCRSPMHMFASLLLSLIHI